MNRYIVCTGFVLLMYISRSDAQKKHVFSLRQTVDYAMQHATDVQNALIDIRIQKQTNREVTAMAFPQINASTTTTRFYDIPVQTLPDFISPAVYGVLVQQGVKDGNGNTIQFPQNGFKSLPAQFGTNWTGSAGIDFSQLLFEGQVFIGLKARASTLKLAQQAAEVTKEQIKVNVYKLYYQLVVGNRQAGSIDANIDRFEKLLADTKEIYKNGLAEKLDVQKVEVQLNNLKTEREKITDQLNMGNAALKFLINLPQQDSLQLTDTLSVSSLTELSLNDSLNYDNRKEYQQLKTAIRLGKMNVQRFQLSKFPTIAFFASYSKNAQRNDFSFFESGRWFNTSLAGIKMTLPLFDGFARNSRIERARLELEKTKNTMSRLEQAMQMETDNSRKRLETAVKSLQIQTANLQLAENVFQATKLKYDQGLGSQMEIYNAQTEMKVSQNNYYGAIYDAIIAKTDYLKAIGKLP